MFETITTYFQQVHSFQWSPSFLLVNIWFFFFCTWTILISILNHIEPPCLNHIFWYSWCFTAGFYAHLNPRCPPCPPRPRRLRRRKRRLRRRRPRRRRRRKRRRRRCRRSRSRRSRRKRRRTRSWAVQRCSGIIILCIYIYNVCVFIWFISYIIILYIIILRESLLVFL